MPQLQETLSKVQELNNGDHPFKYSVSDSTIVGTWDITNSRWFAPGSVTDIIEKYSLTIKLNEESGKFTTSETKKSQSFKIGLGTDGTINLGGEMNGFMGSTNQKSISFGIGGEKDGSNGIGVNSIKFDTAQIKNPIYSLLKELGWKKKGIFG